MNLEKYVKEYYDNYEKNAEGQIKGTVEDFIKSSIQDFLVEKGYGRSNAEAFIDFITTNNKQIDYSHILDIDDDKELYAKIADLEVFKNINKLRDCNNLLNDSLGTYQLCIKLDKQMKENGGCEPEELKELLSIILDSSINAVNAMPGSNIFSKTAYQGLKSYILDFTDFIIDDSNQKKINGFLTGSSLLTKEQWGELFDGHWEKGPSISELEYIYEQYGSEASALDSYLEWRVAYEYNQGLEKYFNDNNIDMTVEEYFDMMDKLTDDRPWYEKLANRLGFETDNISEFWGSSNDKDVPLTYNPVENLLKETNKKVITARTTRCDPLILDIDGDGFNVEKKEFGANFDLDKNGFAEKINWTKKDGFLCLDLNGNGVIDDGGELFGDQTMLADGTKAKNGFEALAQYDSNGDGVIDADDEIFGSLRVWVDADGNGISGEGEMKTLVELGITSINLGYENVNAETGTEATIGNTATFTREDGTTGGVGELWVSSDLFDTVDRLDIAISDEIAALPDIKSIGNVYSLRNAVALDETGELKALVESFVSEEDADKRIAITEQILFFISGAKNIAANSRGAYIDARQLAVIEAMLGEKYVGTSGANPHSDAAPMLKSAYQDLLNMYFCELNAQTFIKDYAVLLRYTENEDGTKALNADLVNHILEYQLENGDENAKKILTEVARYVQYLDNGGIKGINAFIINYATISTKYAAEIAKVMPNGYVSDGENPLKGTNNGDFLLGSNNNDEIYGYSGNDVLIGGKGNDYLYGGNGDDTYIFNLGDGNDVIDDGNNGSINNDRLIFGEGISADDIIWGRDGKDMIIKIKDTDDSIRIVNQYAYSYHWVDSFEFADGTTFTARELLDTSLTINGSGVIKDFTDGWGTRDTTLVGSDGSDSIYGYDGNDVLIGGKGNDYLYGGNGDDTYIFNLGDGNDVIDDGNNGSINNDRLIFGEGISIDNIMFSKNGDHLIIYYGNDGDTVTINNQRYDYHAIENFETSDGYSISNKQVNLLIQSMASFEADTGMSWAEAAEQPTEEYSDIISQMWVKSVS